jgi:hypothetical protein
MSVQVHSGPPQGCTLHSSTITMANQQAVLHPRLCRCNDLCWFAPRVEWRTNLSHSASDQDASPASIRFPPGNFKHSLTLFSNSFSSFPHSTCSLSISRPYLALDGIYHPIRATFPNNLTSPTTPRGAAGSRPNGVVTLSGAPFQGTWARSVAKDTSIDYNSGDAATRFSCWALLGSLAVTRGILVSLFSSA